MCVCVRVCVHLLIAMIYFFTVTTKVVIIGAGVAGISAAKTLHDSGMTDFIIIEGSDRIGGRLKSAAFAGKTIEIGGNWIHGTNGNPIWKIAQKHKLAGIISNFDSYTVRDEHGEDVTEDADQQYDSLGLAEDKVEEILRRKLRDNSGDIPLRVALTMSGWKPHTPIQNAIDYWEYDHEYCSTAEMTSLKNSVMWSYIDYDDHDFLVDDPRGFETVVTGMADEFLERDDERVRFNEVVDKIEYSDSSIKVHTKTNITYQAEYAILTVSIGVLQNDVITFVPELPYWKREKIHQNSIGSYTKVFLAFPKQFWDDTEYILFAQRRRGYFVVWSNMVQEDSAEADTPKILMATLTGAEGAEMEQLSDDLIQEEAMATLTAMYGSDIPEPTDILVTRWNSDPLFYGAYTNWPTGMTDKDIEQFCAPVGRLHFAGEAYSVKYNGYVHGGYLSGKETGGKIHGLMKGTGGEDTQVVNISNSDPREQNGKTESSREN